jgi:protein-tyrosine phosphatase
LHGRTLSQIYRLALERRKASICETISVLTEPGMLPAIVHCNAGLDRTGLVIALCLSLAKVPARIVATDYAWHTRRLDRFPGFEKQVRNRTLRGSQHKSATMTMVSRPAWVMLETLAWLDEQYGGVDKYLAGIGVGYVRRATLRNSLVVPKL